MIFIYLFEDDKRYIKEVYPLFKQAESQKISLATSIISVIETLSPSKYATDPEIKSEILQFFQETKGLTVSFINWEIAQKSASLRQENKSLRVPDSIQLATAITSNATIFVTNDSKLANLSIPGLKIRSL